MDKHDAGDAAFSMLMLGAVLLFAITFVGFIGWATMFTIGAVSFGPFSFADYGKFLGLGCVVIAGLGVCVCVLYGLALQFFDED